MNNNYCDLIRHFVRENEDEVLAKSLLHCHGNNIHSIMLSEKKNGGTIRLFVAEPGHNLDINNFGGLVGEIKPDFRRMKKSTLFLLFVNLIFLLVIPL